LVFAIVLAVAVYTVVSGAIAMSSSRSCGPGWDTAWRVVPPGWECHRDLGR
jgi:hypothetical protein